MSVNLEKMPLELHKAESKQLPIISGKIFIGNAMWNLVGQVLPLVAAVLLIPLLIRGLGTDRFGVLTLAWMLIGYFSLFDLGMGQALAKVVAEKLGKQEIHIIPSLSLSALILMAGLGFIGSLVMIVSTPWLVHSVLKIPLNIQEQV